MVNQIRKYKDELPLCTITRIRNILKGLGILTVETIWAHSADDFYSVTVAIANTPLTTNGKGTTYEYALASAYGELMERLENLAPFKLNTDIKQAVIEDQGFFYAPDEKIMSFDEVLNSEEEWLQKKLSPIKSPAEKKILLKKWQNISMEEVPGDFIAIPFCNLNSGQISYIPVKMVSKMYMSNGMCAGNTMEEALVQGISEVMERNANKRIINEKLTPPTIPKDYFNTYPQIEKMISQIESIKNAKIILKDCSLGKGFPVVGVIYIDPGEQSYFVKFGAHPVFQIAVERTLTELLQGQDIRNMRGVWEFSYQKKVFDQHRNLINIFVSSWGCYPLEFFKSVPDYEFQPFTYTDNLTNKEMVRYLLNLLSNQGYEVYLRNVSFLGFPAFQIIVPDLSEIEEIDEISELDNYGDFMRTKKQIRKINGLNKKEREQLISYLENQSFHFDLSVFQLLNLPVIKVLPWYYTNTYLFLAALYCQNKDFCSAARIIDQFLTGIPREAFSKTLITYYKCLRDYLFAYSDGLCQSEIFDILTIFYPHQMVDRIMLEFAHPEYIFSFQHVIQCFDCDDCHFQAHCQYENIERVYRILKQRYSLSRLNQRELSELL